jgi:hypothetical protein
MSDEDGYPHWIALFQFKDDLEECSALGPFCNHSGSGFAVTLQELQNSDGPYPPEKAQWYPVSYTEGSEEFDEWAREAVEAAERGYISVPLRGTRVIHLEEFPQFQMNQMDLDLDQMEAQ